MSSEDLDEIFTDFLNAIEAAAVSAKRQIAEVKGVAEKEAPVNFESLFWETKKGEKGDYQQTSEKANGNNDLWKQLKVKVKEHKGFWQNGDCKFWFHQQDENVIDRRKI